MCTHDFTPTKIKDKFGENAVEDVEKTIERVAKSYRNVVNSGADSYQEFVEDLSKSVIDILGAKV